MAGITIVPRSVLPGAETPPPSERLNIAGIGVGGQGGGVLTDMEDENIVALCDVDWTKAAGTFGRFERAKKYKDYFARSIGRVLESELITRMITSDGS